MTFQWAGKNTAHDRTEYVLRIVGLTCYIFICTLYSVDVMQKKKKGIEHFH